MSRTPSPAPRPQVAARSRRGPPGVGRRRRAGRAEPTHRTRVVVSSHAGGRVGPWPARLTASLSGARAIGVADDGERRSQLSLSKDERQRQGAFAGTGPLGTAVLVAQLRPAGASRDHAVQAPVRRPPGACTPTSRRLYTDLQAPVRRPPAPVRRPPGACTRAPSPNARRFVAITIGIHYVPVGTALSGRPPRDRTRRADFPHRAPTSGQRAANLASGQG